MLLRKPPGNMSEPDKERHPTFRRYTRRYRRKRKIVRDMWIVSGLLMLCVPLNVILALLLGTTFLAFMVLDETP